MEWGGSVVVGGGSGGLLSFAAGAAFGEITNPGHLKRAAGVETLNSSNPVDYIFASTAKVRELVDLLLIVLTSFWAGESNHAFARSMLSKDRITNR
jgi:hypothetical protein